MADTALPQDPTFTDLRSALGKPAPVATEEVKPAEVKPAEVKTEEAKVEEVKPAEPVVAVDKKPKRFSELTKRAQDWEARALAAEAALVVVTPAPPAEVKPLEGKPVAPNADTFTGTWQELQAANAKHVEDYAQWAVQAALRGQEVAKAQAAATERAETVNRSWKEQYDAAIETDETAEAAVKKVAPIIGRLGIADVLKESNVAVEIIKVLDGDAAKLEALSKMSVASAAREIGRIEAAVLATKAAPAVAAKAAKLPDPPALVGGGAAGSAPGIDMTKLGDLPIDQLRKVVNGLPKARTQLSVRNGSIGR